MPILDGPISLVQSGLEFVGEASALLVDSIRRFPTRPFEWKETLAQMAFIGVASVPIVILTAFFSGAVLSLYLSEFLLKYGATQFIGATVGLTATREIGPVIAGITVSARCGSAMAAQIGSMAVTEQLDALRMLSVHPTKFLVIPRLLAGLLMLPVLGILSSYSSATGAYLVAIWQHVPSGTFLHSVQSFTRPGDLFSGLVKTPVFGVIIALVACQQGLRTTNGAEGVGKATTNAVVISIILVYMADFLIATFLY